MFHLKQLYSKKYPLLFRNVCLKKRATLLYLKSIQSKHEVNFNNHKTKKCPWKNFKWSVNPSLRLQYHTFANDEWRIRLKKWILIISTVCCRMEKVKRVKLSGFKNRQL